MKRALIVEDDRQIRRVMKAYIDHTGKFDGADAVESGELALEIYEPGKYSIVIMDIALIKMTGVDAALEIRKVDPDVTIIGITGYEELLRKCDFSIAGFDACYAKPFGYKEFFDYIRDFT